MSITGVELSLKELLSDPDRRQEFFRSIVQDEIASQIRSTRKMRGMTQSDLAEAAGMKQSAVSRIEQAEYSSWTLATLFRVAAALNARWKMVLQRSEDAVMEYENLGSHTHVQPCEVQLGQSVAELPQLQPSSPYTQWTSFETKNLLAFAYRKNFDAPTRSPTHTRDAMVQRTDPETGYFQLANQLPQKKQSVASVPAAHSLNG